MELIHIAPNGDYARYEELTLQKEELEKEAESCCIAYIREFGELTTKAFALKIDCIALKKEIALYVAARNKGKTITAQEVNEHLQRHMTAYQAELARMLREKEAAKKAEPVSGFTAAQLKAIYRRLAKILHPDISPLTQKYPRLRDLFHRVTVTYRCSDLKELQKLEVLIKKELEEKGIENFNMVIPDIARRISELEQDIDGIIHSEPYSYKKLLTDGEAVKRKKEELNTEIDEYTRYKKELAEKLTELKEANENG